MKQATQWICHVEHAPLQTVRQRRKSRGHQLGQKKPWFLRLFLQHLIQLYIQFTIPQLSHHVHPLPHVFLFGVCVCVSTYRNKLWLVLRWLADLAAASQARLSMKDTTPESQGWVGRWCCVDLIPCGFIRLTALQWEWICRICRKPIILNLGTIARVCKQQAAPREVQLAMAIHSLCEAHRHAAWPQEACCVNVQRAHLSRMHHEAPELFTKKTSIVPICDDWQEEKLYASTLVRPHFHGWNRADIVVSYILRIFDLLETPNERSPYSTFFTLHFFNTPARYCNSLFFPKVCSIL